MHMTMQKWRSPRLTGCGYWVGSSANLS
jgi:hypothetical protein